MTDLPTDAPNQRCTSCGAPFTCGALAGAERCWCMDLPRVLPVLPDTTCLCPPCLRAAVDEARRA